jgi:flagellar assembly protein FliH
MQRWELPSFDHVNSADQPALPSVDELQNMRAKAHQDAFARGLQEGLTEGRSQGFELGKQEGFESGRTEGFQTGFQQGYQSGSTAVEHHRNSLQQVLETLRDLPEVIQDSLSAWVYESALRLSGKASMDRSVFTAAVQEALMRLPRPGEQLLIRTCPQDVAAWTSLTEGAFATQTIVQPDPELQSGQAYVEVAGVRLDVSEQARKALVQSALGLMPTRSDDSA